MAMYNGREVSVNPNDLQVVVPATVAVQGESGLQKVPTGQVKFTSDEKSKIKEVQDKSVDNLNELTDKDVSDLRDRKEAQKAAAESESDKADKPAKESSKSEVTSFKTPNSNQ